MRRICLLSAELRPKELIALSESTGVKNQGAAREIRQPIGRRSQREMSASRNANLSLDSV